MNMRANCVGSFEQKRRIFLTPSRLRWIDSECEFLFLVRISLFIKFDGIFITTTTVFSSYHSCVCKSDSLNSKCVKVLFPRRRAAKLSGDGFVGYSLFFVQKGGEKCSVSWRKLMAKIWASFISIRSSPNTAMIDYNFLFVVFLKIERILSERGEIKRWSTLFAVELLKINLFYRLYESFSNFHENM